MIINHLNLSSPASDASLPSFKRVSWVSDVGLGSVRGKKGSTLSSLCLLSLWNRVLLQVQGHVNKSVGIFAKLVLCYCYNKPQKPFTFKLLPDLHFHILFSFLTAAAWCPLFFSTLTCFSSLHLTEALLFSANPLHLVKCLPIWLYSLTQIANQTSAGSISQHVKHNGCHCLQETLAISAVIINHSETTENDGGQK